MCKNKAKQDRDFHVESYLLTKETGSTLGGFEHVMTSFHFLDNGEGHCMSFNVHAVLSGG